MRQNSYEELDEPGEKNDAPKHRKLFHDIRTYVALFFLLVVIESSMTAYIVSVLTTLERRYSFSTTQEGILASAGFMGTFVSIPIVSHFLGGPNHHRPRWMGVGVLVMCFSVVLCTLPQFLSEPYTYDQAKNSSSEAGLCLTGTTNEPECGEDERQRTTEDDMAYYLYFAGRVIAGIGSSFYNTLGYSYIDDHAGVKSSFYIGLVDGAWGIGGPLGFGVISSACLKKYVDFYRVDMSTMDLTENDPRWVGAWWLGGVGGIVASLLLAIPFFMFPKSLPGGRKDIPESDRRYTESKAPVYEGSNLLSHGKAILVTAWSMIKNPIFILTILGYTINNPVGFILFLPKYFQEDLGYTPADANLFVALMWLFPNFPSGVVCGYIIKRMKLQLIGLTKLCMILVGVIIVSNSLAIALPCEGVYLEGSREGNLVADCNTDCNCILDHYQPVCGSNGLNYYSPCYAGCAETISAKNYTMCDCIDAVNPRNTFAADELCVQPGCQYFIPFLIVMVFFSIANSTVSLPVTMISLRCVDENKKSFSLGMKNLIRSTLLIPYGIIAGKLIDVTCILWREECGVTGACAQYDHVLFRVVFLSASAALSGVAFVFFCLVLFLLKRRQKKDSENVLGITMTSITDNGMNNPSYTVDGTRVYRRRRLYTSCCCG